jgi:ubiquinone/menaquinone biosynthesis C-methylase UbiE
MKDSFGSETWQKYWIPPESEWTKAESSVEMICKVFAENGVASGKVLDLCCGTGRLSIWLAKRGFTAVGLDVSSVYLREAKRKAREHRVESGVRFYQGDMRNVDDVVAGESPFDCVISFRNSLGFWGDKEDEAIFTKVREMTRMGGVLLIGECDHVGQMMLSFDKTRTYQSRKGVMISEASMDYVSGMFKAVFRYYTREGNSLRYCDSFDYHARVYSVSELSSLLERAGWKVISAYESIEGLRPFTAEAIFKGPTSMNLVAKAI